MGWRHGHFEESVVKVFVLLQIALCKVHNTFKQFKTTYLDIAVPLSGDEHLTTGETGNNQRLQGDQGQGQGQGADDDLDLDYNALPQPRRRNRGRPTSPAASQIRIDGEADLDRGRDASHALDAIGSGHNKSARPLTTEVAFGKGQSQTPARSPKKHSKRAGSGGWRGRLKSTGSASGGAGLVSDDESLNSGQKPETNAGDIEDESQIVDNGDGDDAPEIVNPTEQRVRGNPPRAKKRKGRRGKGVGKKSTSTRRSGAAHQKQSLGSVLAGAVSGKPSSGQRRKKKSTIQLKKHVLWSIFMRIAVVIPILISIPKSMSMHTPM